MIIRTIHEANEALLPYVPLVAQLTGKDTVLDRIIPLMELLGNPQDQLKVIHIAGTSGKTSTAYYIAALLTATPKKVGLTVSPHVDSVTERVQIDGAPISEDLFCSELQEFLVIVEQLQDKPSYFELLYAFALWVFARQKVDYAVIETGMGGLFDATNVVTRADKVCVITDIGFDHTHILGSTLREIASQKIGIVHERNAVFTYRQSVEVMEAFESWCAEHQATLQVLDANQERLQSTTVLLPIAAYQQRNWLLARRTYLYLVERDALPTITEEVAKSTQLVQVPGRMDVFDVQGKTIVMDGAHNAQKIAAFVESFQKLYPGVRPVVLIALKNGKEYQTVAPLIAQVSDHVIVTTFNATQDLPVDSMDTKTLASTLQGNDVTTVEIIDDQAEALNKLLVAPGEFAVIVGSFYLLSQIRHNPVFMHAAV